MTGTGTILVLAKEPRPGRVKTRLCPPFSPEEAAELAAAALRDTLDAVSLATCERRVLAFDGDASTWLPPGFDLLVQGSGSLDARLAQAFAHTTGPTVLIGMDTPQVRPPMLEAALGALRAYDAVLAPACDGGYWLVGLRRPDPRAFLGVAMSIDETCVLQQARLAELGLRTAMLTTLRDVDDHVDAAAVAGDAPATNFAAVHAQLAVNARLRVTA